MIKSMTGYGAAKGQTAGFDVSVELKSVNNRYLETAVRLPRNFIFAEDKIKSVVQKHISRGKVDVFVTLNAVTADDITVRVNSSLLKGYVSAISGIAEDYSVTNDMTAMNLARLPDVLTVERNETDAEAVSEGICAILEEALADFDKMRIREGTKLRADVLSRTDTIEAYVARVEEAAPETSKAYYERLKKKMLEVLGTSGIDENRILQEAAVYADHICVDEETVRLRSHISQLRDMMESDVPVGRKADFLIQEFNREANTIGSKCQNLGIARTVVDLKSEIEKIREQIQNIE